MYYIIKNARKQITYLRIVSDLIIFPQFNLTKRLFHLIYKFNIQERMRMLLIKL